MAEEGTGFVFTQSGVPVRGSAEYQRVFDSRWRFMEIDQEVEVTVHFPAADPVDASARYLQEVPIINHNLGFHPAYESDIPDAGGNGGFGGFMWADEKRIFGRRLVSSSGRSEETFTGKIRIYNLPILESYVAPKGLPQGLSSPRGPAGVKFLDENARGANIGSNSPVGFSIDTSKKVLAVHRHGLADINEAFGHTAQVTGINTSTDVITITLPPFGYPYPDDISWFTESLGKRVIYQSSGLPSALSMGQTYFVIPVTPTTIKLAETYERAVQGLAINFTDTGTIDGNTVIQGVPGPDDNKIFHGVGYPPTFFLALVNWEDYYTPIPGYDPGRLIGPIITGPPTFMRADQDNLSFFGVQTVFYGKYGYVVLKDPAEIAR